MVYHLSHTDLDGYGCQMVSLKKFGEKEVKYFNSGYGKQIDFMFVKILNEIKENDILLITDLNLSMEQAKFIDKESKQIGFNLLLLDHHETGKPVAAEFDWYNLDINHCATMLTWNILLKEHEENLHYLNDKLNYLEDEIDYLEGGIDYLKDESDYLSNEINYLSNMKYIVNLIEVNDLWKEKDQDFNKAKSLNQILFDNKKTFPKVLSDLETFYLIYLIENVGVMYKYNDYIPGIENNLYNIQLKYFSIDKELNMPLHVQKIYYMYRYLVESKDYQSLTDINGKIGVVFFDLDSIFQEFSHMYLKKNKNIDFVVNITTFGKLSFRTEKDDCSVSDICKEYFNGGGHRKAAGGMLFNSSEIKKYDMKLAFDSFNENVDFIDTMDCLNEIIEN